MMSLISALRLQPENMVAAMKSPANRTHSREACGRNLTLVCWVVMDVSRPKARETRRIECGTVGSQLHAAPSTLPSGRNILQAHCSGQIVQSHPRLWTDQGADDSNPSAKDADARTWLSHGNSNARVCACWSATAIVALPPQLCSPTLHVKLPVVN